VNGVPKIRREVRLDDIPDPARSVRRLDQLGVLVNREEDDRRVAPAARSAGATSRPDIPGIEKSRVEH